MKRILLILPFVALIGMVACQDEESELLSNSDFRSVLIPAERVETRFCYAMDDEDLRIMKTEPYYFQEKYIGQYQYLYDQNRERYDSIDRTIHHAPMSYDNLRILFYTRTSSRPIESWTTEEERKGWNKYMAFSEVTSQKVLPPGSQYEETAAITKGRFSMYPVFYTARISDKVTIKADKVLFGQEVGNDLSKHFDVETPNPCLPIGPFEDFSFLFCYDEGECPQAVQDYLFKGTWFQKAYVFRLHDLPKEETDEVTFTISIPLECEYWQEYFLQSLTEVRKEARTLTAACTFHFGLPSNFEANYSLYKAENDQLEW